MAADSSQQALLVRGGDVEAAVVEGQNVQIQELGTRVVVVGNYMYSRTNFYINESRPYVGKQKLTRYLYIKWLHWLCIPVFLGSLFSPFNYIATFVLCAVNLLILVLYVQHVYVNITTMWYVLKQPSVPDNELNSNNAFFQVQLDRYAALYAMSHRAGIGRVFRSTQTVEFQVFRKSAVRVMKNCVAVSTLCFLGSLFTFFYCYVWGLVLVLEGHV